MPPQPKNTLANLLEWIECMKHKYLDTEQPWPVIALLAIGSVALGTIVAALTNPLISFFSGALFVVFGVRLINWLG